MQHQVTLLKLQYYACIMAHTYVPSTDFFPLVSLLSVAFAKVISKQWHKTINYRLNT